MHVWWNSRLCAWHWASLDQSQDNLTWFKFFLLRPAIYLASSDRDGRLSLHNQSVLIGCGSTETHNAAWRSRLRKEGGDRKGKKKGRRKGGWIGLESLLLTAYATAWVLTSVPELTASRLQLTSCKSRSVWELQHLADRFALPWRWLPARGL